MIKLKKYLVKKLIDEVKCTWRKEKKIWVEPKKGRIINSPGDVYKGKFIYW
jgi:hypothetical protein